MKGLQKLTSIRLAEVLTQKGVIPAETITDALYAQDKHGEPFVDNLVGSGHISEWDLARVVVENFQLPFILAGNYDVNEAASGKLDREVLFENLLVPLDVFGDVLTVVMPILTPYQTLQKIQKQYEVQIFPYVGLVPENKKILSELFEDFHDWYQKATEEKAEQIKARSSSKSEEGDGDWMNIFDSGEQAVRSSLDRKKE
ncbi:MAG: GspE/PulE/PilB domain-containing protein [Planctomycetota bacterium]